MFHSYMYSFSSPPPKSILADPKRPLWIVCQDNTLRCNEVVVYIQFADGTMQWWCHNTDQGFEKYIQEKKCGSFHVLVSTSLSIDCHEITWGKGMYPPFYQGGSKICDAFLKFESGSVTGRGAKEIWVNKSSI